jgi:ornithine cyclodeaminase/alanine dehydrogenase-like protein (mu-crystallin family)
MHPDILAAMALLLREDDVRAVIEMPGVIDAVEDAMRELGEGTAQNQPRRRVFAPGGVLNVMFATLPRSGYYGLKSYSIGAGGVRFLVLLYRGGDGQLDAMIEANLLGAYRTGAASAVAARYLAPEAAGEIAVIGAGWQARTQAEALTQTLDVRKARVFSPTREKRENFAAELTDRLAVEAAPAPSAQAAVRGAKVVVTMTTAADPVLEADWIEPGALVIAAGSNRADHAEIPPALVASADRIIVDQLEAARLESGDLLRAERAGAFDWSRARELGAVIAGKAEGRRSERGTVLFESHGLAIWDVAAGAVALERARQQGLGEEVSLFD